MIKTHMLILFTKWEMYFLHPLQVSNILKVNINFKRRALIVYKQWLSLKFIIINLYVGNHLHLVINI
jgi:hypothetical protein